MGQAAIPSQFTEVTAITCECIHSAPSTPCCRYQASFTSLASSPTLWTTCLSYNKIRLAIIYNFHLSTHNMRMATHMASLHFTVASCVAHPSQRISQSVEHAGVMVDGVDCGNCGRVRQRHASEPPEAAGASPVGADCRELPALHSMCLHTSIKCSTVRC